MRLLEVRGLHHQRLHCCDFSVDAGAVVVVTGPSGAGKTQLLRAIADLDPAAGEVFLDGAGRADIAAPLWRKQVAYVAATPAWWGASVRDHFEPDQFDDATRLLEDAGLEGNALGWPVDRLSTGETQRIGLIRALARSPRVLLLDEPTSGLDEDSRQRVERLFDRLLGDGGAIIVAAHHHGRLDELARTRLVVAPGGIVSRVEQ
jgi:ABC-type iron transport system FetAB ATPase subunit